MTALLEYAKIVILSPHLDDAVLSCGALIADARKAGADVIVVTVFNGRPVAPVSDPAKRFHARCGHTDETAMYEREIEDDRALAVVGARSERLYLPEALYRKDNDGEPLYATDTAIFQETFAPSTAELWDVERRIAECVGALDPDIVLAPIGIGGHVDHLLVSAAARQLDRTVLHYEDVPYLLYDHCKNWQEGFLGRSAYTHICTAAGWSKKISGIECYTSQKTLLWYSPETWRDDLASYARSIGGGECAERYWSLNER